MISVGLDIDNVLAGFTEKAHELAEKNFGIDLWSELESKSIWEIEAGDRKVGSLIFGEWNEEILEDAPFIGDGFTKFAKDDELRVILVTARSRDVAQKTQNWLDRNLILGYEDIIFTKDKLKAPCQVLIDDMKENVRKYQNNTRMGILIDKPYNRDEEFRYRAEDLHEAYNIIKQFTL